MKIAIVHPHPLPFAVGGAENLWWGVQRHIVKLTAHSCDLVTMGSPESDLWSIADAYESFARKDLSAYDLVISGKYPAWMVSHPNHVCFLQHKLRGLYDAYPLTPRDERAISIDPPAADVLAWMAEARGGPLTAAHAMTLFARLAQLRAVGLSDETKAFPGPFTKAVVHFLDDCALNRTAIRRFLTQSRTVRDRLRYFPPGVDIGVVHPPSHREDYFCAGDDYLFTSSRLDRTKRIDQIILSMREVDADIPLLIAGTGPDESRLRELAGDDSRIRFLGFVDDDAMPGLLAGSLAVPFVPWLEDYGLVAVEAMKSSKPVLTFSDSGGPCELVQDGTTGFITPPSPAALAARINELCADRAKAREMGRAGFAAARRINWDDFIGELVGRDRPAAHAPLPSRKKLTVATTFPIWPPRGGGQARVFHLYRNLARHYDVDIVSLAAPYQPEFEAEIAPGLREIRIAKTEAHEQGERTYRARVGEIALTDMSMPTLSRLTPGYRQALRASVTGSLAVIACHPYLIDDIRTTATGKLLWYEAQDVEYALKETLLQDRGPIGPQLLGDVGRVERAAWREADLVFACAERDLGQLQSLYGPTRARLATVPNGVALEETSFVGIAERRRRKQELGFTGPVALFMGSWHGPNIESVRHIFEYAAQLPEVSFLIMGSAGRAVANDSFPSNVKLLGEVDVPTRQALLATADVALNPTFSGSGTNVKMLDYFGAGIPVVSTRFGARGIDAVDGVHATLTDGDSFVDGLKVAIRMSDEQASAMVANARRLVEERYSWESIAEGLNDIIVQHWPVSS